MLAIKKGYMRSFKQTPAELYQFVPEVEEDKIHFKATEEGLSFRLPSIRVRAITMYDLEMMLKELIPIEDAGFGGGIDDKGNAGIVKWISWEAWTKTKPDETATAIFNITKIKGLTAPEPHKTIVAAMEAAWQVGGKRAVGTKVSYHADTGLLMLHGLKTEIEMAKQVFDALSPNGGARSEATTLVDLKSELALLRKAAPAGGVREGGRGGLPFSKLPGPRTET